MFSKTMSKVANGVSGDGLAVRLLMAGAHKFNIDDGMLCFQCRSSD